jgi:DNA-binding GntR family transcriptional regulator
MTSGTLRRKAYNYIHAKILSGDLPNGHQVSELSLAKEIGISRTPVREAVQQLQREGLVQQIPRLGTIVRTPDRRDIVELFELREALEPFAVGLAAQHPPRSDFPTLEKLCTEMDGIGEELQQAGMTTLDPGRLKRFLTADMAFHVMLLRASGNHRMMRIIADSRVLIRIFSSRRQEHNLAILRETHQFHSQILEAIRNEDPPTATAAMAEHIQASKRETLEHYDRVAAAAGGRLSLGLPEHLVEELDKVTHELEVEE